MGSKGRTFVVELLRFHLVGAGTLMIGTAVFLAMVWAGTSYVAALVGDYAAGILFSYFMNKKFTFAAKVDSDALPLFVTVLSYALTFLLNVLLLALAVEVYRLNVIYSQLVIMLALALLNFVMMKYLVFGILASRSQPGPSRVGGGPPATVAGHMANSTEMFDAEYFRMAAVEADMWWYAGLHADLLDTIQRHFGDNRQIRILDAGCGTGGLLRFLRRHGYQDSVGIDISDIAVRFSREQGFPVIQGSIADSATLQQAGKVDLIVSMDVICSLPDETARVDFLREAEGLLREGGLMVVQTPAFASLGGIHDMAVGVNKRYDKREMRQVLARAHIHNYRLRYRLVLLTPLIFVVRSLQRLRLRYGNDVPIESDVTMPSRVINSLLYSLQRVEDRWLPCRPFGTSLQLLISKGQGDDEIRTG